MTLIQEMMERQAIDTYQMEFVEYKKPARAYGNENVSFEKHIKFPCFKLPEGMTESEAYAILTYFYNQTSKALAVKNCLITKEKITTVLNQNLTNLGFVLVANTDIVKTLYVVESNGDWRTKLRYEASSKGEPWRFPRITKEVIEEIYFAQRMNMPAIDVNLNSQQEETIINLR